MRRILPSAIADSVRPTGSRLAHLHGLPKTHKKKLAMRPILSATGTYTYNYALENVGLRYAHGLLHFRHCIQQLLIFFVSMHSWQRSEQRSRLHSRHRSAGCSAGQHFETYLELEQVGSKAG